MKRCLLACAIVGGLGSIESQALADTPGYAASVFEPSERGSDWFANESNDYRGKFRFAIGAVGDYGYRPVIGTYNANGTVRASVLREQVLLHTGAALVFADRFRLAASLPLQLDAYGHAANVDGVIYAPPVHAQTIGDIRGSLDIRLLGEYGEAFTLAVGGSVFFPTGLRKDFTSDEYVRFAPHLNIAGDVGPLAYAARGGYELRPLRENYIDTRTGSTITFGGAVGIRFADKHLLIGPEAYGRTTISNNGGLSTHDTPIEALMGAHLNVAHGFRVNAGAGTMLDNGFGAARFRGVFGIEWFPEPEKSDRDKDGIYDEDDACPDQAGVRTADPKTNGCPAPIPPPVAVVAAPSDRDQDGIIDPEDACPDVPGVRTNDPKTNGCPGDRDGDGVLDKDDACPDVAGIKTSDPKTNGCPDTDRDKDGVLNDQDACPDEAGPRTSDPKTSGCPRVSIKAGLIQILEQPKFDFNKAVIKSESDSLLEEVAKVMTDHPEVKRVRVEGHTDNVGSAEYNQKLSQQRADAVVKWLSSHGIAAGRLTSKGMGKETPLVPNDSDLNRSLNRRVEFHIEDQTQMTKEVIKTPQGTVPAKP